MNRTIKFRAWSPEQKRMFQVDSLQTTGKDDATWEIGYWDKDVEFKQYLIHLQGCNCEKHGKDNNLDCIRLMQFTGLLDKNGKEIFEGDIVTAKHRTLLNDIDNVHEDIAYSTNIGEIVYRQDNNLDGGYGGFYAIYNDEVAFHISWCVNGEVVGNIYENPDLLSSNNRSRE